MKSNVKNNDVKLSKRIVSALILVIYLLVLSPATLFAQELNQSIERRANRIKGPLIAGAVGERSLSADKINLTDEKSAKLIIAKDGGFITLGSASIDIPSGALKNDTEISITHLNSVEETGESLFNAIPDFGGYRFLPKGTKFEKDVIVTLPYDPVLNSKPQSLEDLYTYFYDTEKKEWVKLERVEIDQKNCVVKSRTNHFTDMINATLTLPESASPVDVNLNSIKNLEAAKPDSHLIKFNPPQVSNTGDAAFSFELEIPGGRHGMQPSISISYSSAGGNGIMGKGFDINYGSIITTDTRFGLPDYSLDLDPESKKGRFLLDGVLLKVKKVNSNKTVIEYEPLKEAGFEKIIRYDPLTENDCWVVTSKNGTKKNFDNTSTSCVGVSDKKIFTWHITKIEDVHGNNVVYNYVKDEEYVYPSSIIYTGKGDTPGLYSVNFNYDKESRKDIRSDARSGHLVTCRWLLTSVTTSYNNETPLRTYEFIYDEGPALEKMLSTLNVTNSNADDCYEYSFDYKKPEYLNVNTIKVFDEPVEWTRGKPIRIGKSNSFGVNSSISLGVGWGWPKVDLRATGGGNVAGSNSSSYAESIMIDINGDGAPDYVSYNKDNGKLTVCPNDNHSFTEERIISFRNNGKIKNDMNLEKTSDVSLGASVYTGVGLAPETKVKGSLGLGYTFTQQNSNSSTIFSFIDMDRDGLVDIVEKGESYFLRNKGNYEFEKCDIHIDNISDFKETLSQPQIESYEKSYFVQTPFRMWKSPYEGIISITETAKGIQGSYKPETSVKTLTYINESKEPESELNIVVDSTNPKTAKKENIDIKKDDHIYFISDNGTEPANSDIEWNVKIDYSKVKALKNNFPAPYIYYSKITNSINDNKLNGRTEEEAKKSFIDKNFKGKNDVILKLFNFNKQSADNSGNAYYYTASINEDWQKSLKNQDEKIQLAKIFEKYKCLIPAVYNEDQFTAYKNYVVEKNSEGKKVQDFISHFVYSPTEDIYYLENADNEFFSDFPVPDTVIVSGLKNYNINGIHPEFDFEKLIYKLNYKVNYENSMYSGNPGSVKGYGLSGKKSNYIKIGTYNDYDLYVKVNDKHLYIFRDDSFCELENTFKEYDSKNEKSIYLLGSDNDSWESKLTISLGTIKYCPESLSQNDFEEIYNDTYVKYQNVYDEHWRFTDGILVEDIDSLFNGLNFEDNQKEIFIKSMYEIIDKDVVTEAQQTITQKFYVLKVSPDYETAQKVLDAYKKKKFFNTEFPYYELNSQSGIYELKEEWKDKDIEICKDHGLGYLNDINIEQEFNSDYLYSVENNNYSLLLIDGNCNIKTQKYYLENTSFDSNKNFDYENLNSEKVITSYPMKDLLDNSEIKSENSFESKISEIESDAEIEVSVVTNELLYGGKNNWFYGIWKDSLRNNPFSTDEFNFSVKESDDLSNNINSKQKEIESTLSDSENEINNVFLDDKSQLSFYKPTKLIDNIYGKSNNSIKNPNVTYDVNYSNSLIGNIAANNDMNSNSDGSVVYYTPFISGDIIHCDRAGGNSFYEIEGLSKSDGENEESLPAISKNYTDGKDHSWKVDASLQGAELDIIKEIESYVCKEGNAGLSGSYGFNNSTSTTKQIIQDFNSDGIPDIVKVDNNGIIVYEGILTEEVIDGKITNSLKYSPDNSFQFSTIKGISETSSDTHSFSCGFTGGGNVHVNKGKVSLGLSTSPGVSNSSSTTTQTKGFIDFNGDGLLDYYDGKNVKLNTGVYDEKTFSVQWGESISAIYSNESNNTSVTDNSGLVPSEGNPIKLSDLGDKIVDGVVNQDNQNEDCSKISNGVNFGIGFSYTDSNSNTTRMLADMNGDGLQDILRIAEISESSDKKIIVSYNTGNGYKESNDSILLPAWNLSDISFDISDSTQPEKFMTGTILEYDSFTNRSEEIDSKLNKNSYLPENSLEWNNTTGFGINGNFGFSGNFPNPTTWGVINFSSSFNSGLNGSFNTSSSNVKMMDLDGDGYYDRNEKENYGFATVTTTFADGSYKIDTYNQGSYYEKGTVRESSSYSPDGKLLSETKTSLWESPYALPKTEENWTYEESSGENEFLYVKNEYEYDGSSSGILYNGNCTKVVQTFGQDEKLTGIINYTDPDERNYIVGFPEEIIVLDKKDNVIRHRFGKYDNKGSLTELRQYFSDYDYSVNKIVYDEYGNILSVEDSRSAKLTYEYDKKQNMFVEKITQSGHGTDSYTSEISYYYNTQTKSEETDCNGNNMRYEYDGWQRPLKIFTSADGNIPAVSYEYYNSSSSNTGDDIKESWYAITNNKVTFDKDDNSIIQTVLQIDGLGRATRTAKTGYVRGCSGWNVSGAVEYDEKGRTIKEGMTEFVEGDLKALLSINPKMTELYTSYEYDCKDRQCKTILPDGAVQSVSYSIQNENLIARTTDPLYNVSEQDSDSRGNIVKVARYDSTGKKLTQVTYDYNSIGEMTAAYDAKKKTVIVEYDLLGRRTALESLDSGRQEYEYDSCSNLIYESSSVLREKNQKIAYEYDGLNRLVKIDYPDTEDTVYVYGGAGAVNKAAGKILSVQDASGTISYEYGDLGEVKKETRTIRTHLNGGSEETAVMEYVSDYLGRMQSITYPDGEEVIYGYDEGGQVISVKGINGINTFDYVNNILYDEYGQRVLIEYGNGVKTEYTYDAERRWLKNIKTENKYSQQFQNINYGFDFAGNVSFYTNDCLTGANGNYKTQQRYTYDGLYQLTGVQGETVYNPYNSYSPEYESSYSQTFAFDEAGLGNMVSKISSESVSPKKTIGDSLNYEFAYNYDERYAHRLINVGNRYYKYDSNGNIICEKDGSFDEETEYGYIINKEAEDVYSTEYGWGLYRENKTSSSAKTYERTYTWNERNQLISSVDTNYNTAYVYGQDGQRSNKYTASSETVYFNKMWTLHTDSENSMYGGQYAKNIYLGETRIVTKLNSASNPTYQEEYHKQYYYHSDHLGSATMISDYKGDEYQRIEYTPYGETWVEKTQNTGNEYLPYKFTGKEMDSETGLYYYGARYLDPKYSMWISTDPALGDYIPIAATNDEAKRHNSNLPGMGGVYNHINFNLYHYAGNNPVRYLDPDGKSISDDGPKGLLVNNSTGKNIIVSPGDKYNYVEAAIINYINTGDIRWLNKIPETSNPLATAGMIAFICDYLGIDQESIVPGISAQEMLGMIATGSMELATTAQKASNAVVKMIGERGTQVFSKTIWKNGRTERIDVENPNPGNRPGQIHYHDSKNHKYRYDIEKNIFFDENTGELAPNRVQNLLNDKDFLNAINKGLKILGE